MLCDKVGKWEKMWKNIVFFAGNMLSFKWIAIFLYSFIMRLLCHFLFQKSMGNEYLCKDKIPVEKEKEECKHGSAEADFNCRGQWA